MTSDTRNIARTVVVHGRVQGVFFRDSCRSKAEEAGVAGWVGNESDGTVRAHFEGTAESVNQLVDWAHAGPSKADVDRVDVGEVDPTGCTGFEVR